MFYITVIFTWGYTLLTALLDALMTRPAGAILTSPTVHLCTNSPSFNWQSAPSVFTEATFNGYSAVVLSALTGPTNLPNQTLGMVGSTTFAYSGSTGTGQMITGYYVTDGGGTTLYGAELFATPIPINGPGDALFLDVIFPLSAMEQTGQTI